MGNMAKNIVKLDINNLLNVLNEAFAEEWLAYYQYWIAIRIASGQMREPVIEEFKKHAHEEREHAEQLATRIIQLGGTPILNPDDWSNVAKCRYEIPLKNDVKTLIEQVLTAERCAIGRYQGICDKCFGKDYETFQLARNILSQEIDHEQDMEDFLQDMQVAKNFYTQA